MDAASAQPTWQNLADLLQSVREGSLEAFDRFYESAAPFVLRLSRSMLADPMEAEDVCHDVLLDVMTHPERYDPSRGTAEAWLAVITKNRCLDRMRKRSRLVFESAHSPLPMRKSPPAEDTERRVLSKLEREAVRRALRELPGLQQQTLAAAYFDRRSHRELAEAWQVPVGTVKSRVRYGLGHLRKAMERLGWAEAEGGGRHD